MGDDTRAALARIARLSAGSFGRTTPKDWPGLIVMTDHERQGDAMAVLEALPPGAALCLRDYTLATRAALASRLGRRAHERGIRFLVGADIRLAMNVGAWGVHIPEGLLRARKIDIDIARRRGLKVTTAVHSQLAALRATTGTQHMRACDAIIVSPVFPTASHPGAKVLGPVRFEQIIRNLSVPAYALGGINLHSASRLRGTSAAGIAGIGFASS